MHIGGAWAKWLTRGDVAVGQGVAPVSDWPPFTGGAFGGAAAAVVGAPDVVGAAAVDAVVLVDDAFLLFPVEVPISRATIPTTTRTASPPAMARRRFDWRRAWARDAAALACALAR